MAAPAPVTLRNLSGKYALVSETPRQKNDVSGQHNNDACYKSTTMRTDQQAQRIRDNI